MDQFLGFIGHFLPQEEFRGSSSDYGSGFAGGRLVPRRSTAGGLDGWAWNRG